MLWFFVFPLVIHSWTLIPNALTDRLGRGAIIGLNEEKNIGYLFGGLSNVNGFGYKINFNETLNNLQFNLINDILPSHLNMIYCYSQCYFQQGENIYIYHSSLMYKFNVVNEQIDIVFYQPISSLRVDACLGGNDFDNTIYVSVGDKLVVHALDTLIYFSFTVSPSRYDFGCVMFENNWYHFGGVDYESQPSITYLYDIRSFNISQNKSFAFFNSRIYPDRLIKLNDSNINFVGTRNYNK